MRRRFVAGLAGALALAMLSGCATGRVSAFVDPAYDDARYDGFLAYAAFSDLGLEAQFERATCDALRNAGHACTTLLAVAPPTRDQDAASRHAASRNSGAQALVIIELADTDDQARQTLAGGAPAFDVRLVDNAKQQVAARFAVTPSGGANDPGATAKAVAAALVRALDTRALLYERGAPNGE